MSGWNRLTNGQRADLVKLAVWTTEEDRRHALSYADRNLTGVEEAITDVRAGRRASANLGVIIAVAHYEAAGWMPDGGFDRWQRWIPHGRIEKLDIGPLVHWLGFIEHDTQQQLIDLESRLSIHCREQDERLATARDAAAQAHQKLHEHRQALILARLSVGDTDGAKEIANRVSVGPARDQIDNVIHEMSALYRDVP